VDGIAEAGGRAMAVRADISEPAAVDSMFAAVEQAWGPVEILVNNAGILDDNLLVRMSDDAWRRVLDTNLGGAFYCTRRAVRSMMRARWGRIVNVASVVGLLGGSGQVNYAAAKAGLLGLTRSVARELATRKITVNSVLPGPVDTDILSDLTPERHDELRRIVPMNRMGTAEEVAAAVGFLCSEAAAFVTGVGLPVDGGMCMGA
jgi:3-oxoacyl-[acyl-carrier protein] reductase